MIGVEHGAKKTFGNKLQSSLKVKSGLLDDLRYVGQICLLEETAGRKTIQREESTSMGDQRPGRNRKNLRMPRVLKFKEMDCTG